jgi:hypothetical protein
MEIDPRTLVRLVCYGVIGFGFAATAPKKWGEARAFGYAVAMATAIAALARI